MITTTLVIILSLHHERIKSIEKATNLWPCESIYTDKKYRGKVEFLCAM